MRSNVVEKPSSVSRTSIVPLSHQICLLTLSMDRRTVEVCPTRPIWTNTFLLLRNNFSSFSFFNYSWLFARRSLFFIFIFFDLWRLCSKKFFKVEIVGPNSFIGKSIVIPNFYFYFTIHARQLACYR